MEKYKGYYISKELKNFPREQKVVALVEVRSIPIRDVPAFRSKKDIAYKDINQPIEKYIRNFLYDLENAVKKYIDLRIEEKEKQQQRGMDFPQIIDEVVNKINKEVRNA